jgi:hypothetical protein
MAPTPANLILLEGIERVCRNADLFGKDMSPHHRLQLDSFALGVIRALLQEAKTGKPVIPDVEPRQMTILPSDHNERRGVFTDNFNRASGPLCDTRGWPQGDPTRPIGNDKAKISEPVSPHWNDTLDG